MTTPFSPTQLAQYRSRLVRLANRIRGTTNDLTEEARQSLGGEAGGSLSDVPLHLADLGTAAFDQEIGAASLENEQYLLGETIAAIERVDRGNYGNCEHCGIAILPERLDTLPYVRYCTPCSVELHDGHRVNVNDGRPGPRVDLASKAKNDFHGAGTAGGGTAVGGLAGSTTGHGDPDEDDLGPATGSGNYDRENDDDEGDVSEDRRR